MSRSSFDLSPDEIRGLGYLAADAVAEHRATLESRPVFGKIGAGASLFEEPVPEEGQPIEKTLGFVREHILPFPMGNSHPRFYGFINATADPVGIAADFLAASMNPNCWGGDHAAIHVEHRVMRWLAEMLGYPADAEGILVSGGSMANFTALAAARRAVAPGNVREGGLAGEGKPRLVVYASDQVHHCVDEAGATLVREPGRLAAAFRKFPEYLASDPESPFPGPAWFAERGVELSRGFKALKVWMGMKTHGRRGYAQAIENDVRLAHFLAAEVDRRPDLERLSETVLSIANFRYRPRGGG